MGDEIFPYGFINHNIFAMHNHSAEQVKNPRGPHLPQYVIFVIGEVFFCTNAVELKLQMAPLAELEPPGTTFSSHSSFRNL